MMQYALNLKGDLQEGISQFNKIQMEDALKRLQTLKVKFGGQTLATVTSTSQAALGFSTWLLNLNSETSQKNGNAVSFTIDTTIANDFVITGQLANAGDTVTLTAVSLEII